VFLAADDADGDGLIDHLLVAAPWLCDRTAERGRGQDRLFERVVLSLESVRAGRLGVIILGRPHALEDGDRLAGPSQLWESRTPYHPARHASRGKDAAEAAVADLVSECERRGLPRPEAQLLELKAGPNGGNPEARFRLRFAVAVEGPILLGRDSHKGGGLFAAARPALLP
jgi:CRISPR-associated protein Csb2